MLSRLVQYIEDVATTAKPWNMGGGATEWVRAVGPLEFILHVNGIGSHSAIVLGRRVLFSYRAWDMGWCVYTPILYYSNDGFGGRIIKLLGRTVWSSPTQEE
jgi:hypothetical protein